MLYAGLIRYVAPESFSIANMFLLLAMVIIGGAEQLLRRALGAALGLYVRERLSSLRDFRRRASARSSS